MEKLEIELKFKAENFRQLWFDFCEKHTHLYEKTCEEYTHLLASELELLESTVDEKQEIIKTINDLEFQRNNVAAEISELLNIKKPEKLKEMESRFEDKDCELVDFYLAKKSL